MKSFQKAKEKIPFDKYYTPPNVARWCIEKAYEVIGKDNITEIIEPSAGCGMFSHQIPGCKAYDLYPQSEYIEQADFLELDMGGYKKGRLFIGNPPFGGHSGKLLKQFYDKSCDNGEYIAYIQPASYYNNYNSLHRYEIIYSCILKTDYTNNELYTSFTIYKKNPDRDDFKPSKEDVTLQDITFIKCNRSNKDKAKYKKNIDYDYSFTTFGVILSECEPYKNAATLAVKIHNKELKDKIISCLKWLYHYNKKTDIFNMKCVSTKNISTKDLIEVLKICIPELK